MLTNGFLMRAGTPTGNWLVKIVTLDGRTLHEEGFKFSLAPVLNTPLSATWLAAASRREEIRWTGGMCYTAPC